MRKASFIGSSVGSARRDVRRHALVWWSGQIRRRARATVNDDRPLCSAQHGASALRDPYNRRMTGFVHRSHTTRARRGLGAALALVALTLAASVIGATGDVRVVDARAREAPPGARTAAVYLTVENRGATPDRLVGARSPRGLVEIHSMSMDGGVMRMRAIPDLTIPARGRVELAAGGLHLMLVDPAPPLKAGERVPLTLTFERAGPVDVDVGVDPLNAPAPHRPH
jgi:copper(I)-binding protein